MNDSEELKFGLSEGLQETNTSLELRDACRSSENFTKFLTSFSRILNVFDTQFALNTYVLCFSEHDKDDNDGRLSMWRGYGNVGAGAAIIFDTSKINFNQNSPFIIGKVHYGSKKERQNFIRNKISVLAAEIKAHFKEDQDLHYFALAWFRRLQIFSLFSKHHGFHEEREWRVVYMNDRDHDQKLAPFFDYIVTNRGVEPKLKLPITSIEGITANDFSLEKLVCKIILGPSLSSKIGVDSLRQMLHKIDKGPLADLVITSSIPFRSA